MEEGQQPVRQPPSKEGDAAMREIWAEAAKAFEIICGQSLQNGDVKSFDDVQRKIESSSKASHGLDTGPEDTWDMAKSVGLQSLKYLKMLIGAASQVSSFIPIPSVAATLTGSALSFVFDIPESIKGYNDAVNQVFGQISSALSQFRIYSSMDKVDPLLVERINAVLVSFVRLCAHVVKYRQGRKRDRLLRQVKSIFDDDSGLASEMDAFKRALQQQRDVEGTITLAVVVETRHDITLLLERFIVFGKTAEETRQIAQDTKKGVQALRDDADRIKTLIKIRDTLGVPATVRLDANTTQTCTNIVNKCLNGTGSWIWADTAYTAWTAAPRDKDKDEEIEKDRYKSSNDTMSLQRPPLPPPPPQNVLLISGPPSSGKTSASALITRRLEEQKGRRIFVAHYFFLPSNSKKSSSANADENDSNKNPVPSAIKYMAFQIARVDGTVANALGKMCDSEPPGAFDHNRSTGGRDGSNALDSLWAKLKIGHSGAVYYLVFDGIEHLPDEQASMLLRFASNPDLGANVRVLVSGTDDFFDSTNTRAVVPATPLTIQMGEKNLSDMRILIDEALNEGRMLQQAKPGSDQQLARDKIIERLPQNVKGSYSLLKFGLENVLNLLSSRTAAHELDRVLDQSVSSHETAISSLQRSLTADEINELNELLKWVLFSRAVLSMKELEAVMFLYSGIESLASLQYIIQKKYSAVLKLETFDDGHVYVYGQDGVEDYLQKEKRNSAQSSHAKDRPTISMTITINNVDQELCGNFLWDLAHKAIRDKFNFNFDLDGPNAVGGGGGVGQSKSIAVDEFEAHHTIVTRIFEFLAREPTAQTADIGEYMVSWLPYHLDRLRQLEDDEEGALMPSEQYEIGQNLYMLFKDDTVFRRHKASFAKAYWIVRDFGSVQKWLNNPAVVRRLDKKWRNEVQLTANPTKGFLRGFTKMMVQGLLRERSWDAKNAWDWLEEIIDAAENKSPRLSQPTNLPRLLESPEPTNANEDDAISIRSFRTASSDMYIETESAGVDWDLVSDWCQDFLGLADSDLDSLWYERMAETASALPSHRFNGGVALSLYQRAIQQGGNPSWLCYRGLGITHYSQGNVEEAIAALKQSLEEASREDATPRPEARDLVELHLLLGNYAYLLGANMQFAAEHYLIASKSDDEEQARIGQLCHLRARMSLPDNNTDNDDSKSNVQVSIQMLKRILAQVGGEKEMADLLMALALDSNHFFLVSKMFKLAKQDPDPDLLRRIVRAMHTATLRSPTTAWNSVRPGDSTERLQWERQFADAEACGVLLYHLGVAAYSYNVVVVATPSSSSDDTVGGSGPSTEALRMWSDSRDQLADVGGRNAFLTRWKATAAIASHYFLDCLERLGESAEEQDRYRHALSKLAELAADEAPVFNSDNAPGFLAALHAMHGDEDKARALLRPDVKQALQILSDDYVENDMVGIAILQKALEKYQDFRNVVAASSLRRLPDVVTEALLVWDVLGEEFGQRKDLDGAGDDEDKNEPEDHQRILQVLELVTKLSKETIQVVKTEFPNAKDQLQRIHKAQAYIDSLVADAATAAASAAVAAAATTTAITAGTNTEQDVNLGDGGDHDGDGQKLVADILSPTETTMETALRLIQSRLSKLKQVHTPSLDLGSDMICSGLTADGMACPNASDCEREFYHCLYCPYRDFCSGCLAELRRTPSRPHYGDGGDIAVVVDMTACNAKHRWLQVPPLGHDMYVGIEATSVRVPKAVRPLNADDEQILKAYYDDGEVEEITMDEWKHRIATEWNLLDLLDSSDEGASLNGPGGEVKV